MKLELKHLAPYLPYDLKIKANSDGNIYLVTGFSAESGNSFKMIELMDEHEGKHFVNFIGAKPILRPLSDLTKEIEINGIRFEPSYWFEICDDENDSLEFDFGNINLIKQIEGIAQNECHHDLQFLPYFVINKFFEWHFDVFGLIPAGLALDYKYY